VSNRDWSSDVCSSDLVIGIPTAYARVANLSCKEITARRGLLILIKQTPCINQISKT
jgi:hypothetical protein